MPPLFLTVIGLIFLVVSASALVEGASRIAYAWGISELMVGLTIVAFGTSAPELMISITSVLQVHNGELNSQAGSDLILGNVMGSNIANIGLILGVSALIRVIRIDPTLLKRDYMWMLGATLVVCVFALDKTFQWWEGMLLLMGSVAFLVVQYRSAQQAVNPEYAQPREKVKLTSQELLLNGGLLLCGIMGLGLGSSWLVKGSTTIARNWGVSEFIIGLTLVAVGTSLPELATSVVASWRHEGDIIVGNIIGSNIFNLILILAAGMSITPLPISDGVKTVQLPLMLALTFALYPLVRAGQAVGRREGAALLTIYGLIMTSAIIFNP